MLNILMKYLKNIYSNFFSFFKKLRTPYKMKLKDFTAFYNTILSLTSNLVIDLTEYIYIVIFPIGDTSIDWVAIALNMIFYFIILGLEVGLLATVVLLSDNMNTSAMIGWYIAMYFCTISLIIFFKRNGTNLEELKFITDFTNKSILPFITVIFMFFGFPGIGEPNFMLLKTDNHINYLGIYFQIIPALFTVSLNFKLLVFSFRNGNDNK